jgi:hypothetical protein
VIEPRSVVDYESAQNFAGSFNSLPFERNGERSGLQRLHLLQRLVVTNQDHRYLSSAPADELGGH